MVTLVQLRVIDTVRRHGSVTAAAKELSYTQPAISHHLTKLESELSAQLLQRVGRGIRLTPAGCWPTGRVRLSGFNSVMSSLVPQAATVLAEKPGMGVTTIPGLALRGHRHPAITATRLPVPPRRIYAARYGEPPTHRDRRARRRSHPGRRRLNRRRQWWSWQTGAVTDLEVRRVDFGYFVRPAAETGTGGPRVEPCLGYLVDHPDGLLLVDTGMGSHPEVDARYRPRRRDLDAALAGAGARVEDVRFVINCHLHFDHCGGNPALPGRPIFVQRTELDAARHVPDYTLPSLVDAPGLRHEVLDGEAEILPDLLVVPTPGHTAGHQSLVVRRPDGTVVVAGQSHDTATAYSADALAWRAHHDHHDAPLPAAPAWIDRLQRLDPARVVFAHDNSVWEPAGPRAM